METRRPVGLGYGLELWAGGASPTKGAGAVGCFLGFPLIQTDSHLSSASDSDCSRSLAHQDRLCCPNRSRVSPSLLIGAGTTNSGSSHAPPCQTLCSPPVGLFFLLLPTQPPTRWDPETRSAPFTDCFVQPTRPPLVRVVTPAS